jgi:hypothetical protein
MRKRVILKNGRYWPQYKFVGLLWCYYREEGDDPYRQPEAVSFHSLEDALKYISSYHNNSTAEQVVWEGR